VDEGSRRARVVDLSETLIYASQTDDPESRIEHGMIFVRDVRPTRRAMLCWNFLTDRSHNPDSRVAINSVTLSHLNFA
jgi:hypothetical protein